MPILTAGYGNRGFENFVALMKRHGVTHLVDVRSVPQSSYWEDFRRERLQHIVPEAGLRYVYMGDTLGGVENSPVLCKDPDSVELAPFFDEPKLALGPRSAHPGRRESDRLSDVWMPPAAPLPPVSISRRGVNSARG